MSKDIRRRWAHGRSRPRRAPRRGRSGALDTPGSGDTVGGTIVNFGWVLTPPPGAIAIDGSTIDVLIDGQSVAGNGTRANRSQPFDFSAGDVSG